MSDTSESQVIVHTDGACRGNPGPGGWGVLVQSGDEREEYLGADSQTTNNRMEIMAAIEALNVTQARDTAIIVYTDSTYVRSGITEWLPNWKKRNWKTAAGKPVKNKDLWQLLEAAADGRDVDWRWVKGHSGDPGNERADELANEAIDTLL